ncbi:MAG: PstS family phosphate ABC transporter substrate-binding protein [Nodosilinea sp.]
MELSRQTFNRYTLAGVVAVTAALGIGTTSALSQGSTIKIDGSSTVFPISEAMAEEFMAQNRGTQVTVGVSGTGGGFKKFCAGELDITGASRPIKGSEADECKAKGIEYVQVEVARDALTVVVHPSNPLTNITSDQLKKIWEPAAEGKITKWNQIDSSWPDAPLALYGPGTDSGTFDFFTATIVGEEGASRTDYTASEDDNTLVLGVSRNATALGYFGMAYYLENQDTLKALSVNGVIPNREDVENGTYKPLSRPLYIYVKKSSLASAPVRSFVEFVLDNAPDIIPEVGYVPLSEARYTAIRQSF